MNGTSPRNDDRARDEAINWVIWLADEPDDADLHARFAAWHADSPANQAAWRHANRVSDLIGQSQKVVFLDPVAAENPENPVVRQRRRTAPILAMTALAACMVAVAAPDVILRIRADHRTGTAEQKTVRLDDGSTVRLGPQSAISVAFAPRERRIRLLSGEAYFEVMRDVRRPFTVQTSDAITTVLGTGFDVQQRADGTDVAVRHGQVRVAYAGSPPITRELRDGQWLASAHGRVTGGNGPASLVGSWRSGTLAVVDRPVGEVIADIRRSYRGIIILNDDHLAARSVSGSFDTADPLAAVVALAQPHEATVRQITPWIIIISSK